MPRTPLISIVTPNLNQGRFLENTINSVLNQNYPNLEYIIIDGGSNDNSIEIIKKYEHSISYWISESDHSMYEAIQKGFDKSSGDIMAWINSDDLYHPNSLFVISEIFSSFPEIKWLQGIPTWFDENGRCVMVDKLRRWSKFDFYTGNYQWIQQESVFWRRDLWEKAGSKLDTSIRYAGDFELWMRFFRFEKLYVTNSLVAGYRVRTEGQISSVYLDQYKDEVKSVIEKETINPVDKKVIRKYKVVTFFLKLMSYLKVFNSRQIETKFREKNFGYSPVVFFNRSKQKFTK